MSPAKSWYISQSYIGHVALLTKVRIPVLPSSNINEMESSIGLYVSALMFGDLYPSSIGSTFMNSYIFHFTVIASKFSNVVSVLSYNKGLLYEYPL